MPSVQDLSVWLLAPLLAIVLIGAHECGSRLRKFLGPRAIRGATDADVAAGEYVRGALSLMSLLIAFTFGAALERYSARRDLLLQETAAIGTYYRQLLKLHEPYRTRLAGNLVHYLEVREAYTAIPDERELDRAAAGSEAAGQQLSFAIISAAREDDGPDLQLALAKSDDMLNAAVARRDALAARVPLAIIRAVLLYSLMASFLMGYAANPAQHLYGAPAIKLVLLALSISLILDLDGAVSGAIRVDQRPLFKVIARVKAFEALRREAPPAPWLAPAP